MKKPTLKPDVITKVENSGVELTLRYLCSPRRRRETEHQIWEDILNAFEDHDDIDFAYPTERRFNHDVEGKMAVKNKIS